MDVKEELKEVPILDVADRLGIKFTQRGSSWQRACLIDPGPSGTAFSIKSGENWFYCFKCGAGGDVIRLIELVHGVEFPQALRWLAENFRPQLLSELNKGDGKPDPEREAFYSKAGLMEKVFEWGRELLLSSSEAKPFRDYLQNKRGLSPDQLQETQWFYLPPLEQIRQYLNEQYSNLQEHTETLLKALQGYTGDQLRLAMPYRDRKGVITGIVKRGVEVKKYDSPALTKDMKKDLCGLHKIPRGEHRLLIVEGYPDTESLPVRGIKNVTAVGQGALGKDHIKGLKARQIEQVIISFDNDPPQVDEKTGEENRLNLERLDRSLNMLRGSGISAFVLDPEWLGVHKDPDEYVQAKGPQAFRELMNRAEEAPKWQARNLLRNKDLSQDIELDQTIREAVQQIEKLPPLEAKLFYNSLVKHSGQNEREIELRFERIRDAIRKEKFQKEVTKALKDAQGSFQGGDIESTLKAIQKATQQLSSVSETKAPPEPYTWEELERDLALFKGGYVTGYDSLDQWARIPEGAISLIAGRPGHGKTTFMLNLLYNMAQNYPAQTHYFFTFEEGRSRLAVKLLMLRSQRTMTTQNYLAFQKYLKEDRKVFPEERDAQIEDAITWYEACVRRRSVTLYDEDLKAENFAEMLRTIAQADNEKGILGTIFVDYVQRLSLENPRRASTRQLEIQQISSMLLEVAKEHSFPLIMGAQLNRQGTQGGAQKGRPRLDHLREAGDLEQDTNLCLGVYNMEMGAEEQGENQAAPKDTVDFEIIGLKNRDGVAGKCSTLNFHKPTLKITEPENKNRKVM